MKISCPNCNATGNIPDQAIPQEGRFLSCPKCNHGFTVMKPKATIGAYELDTCPACNYSTFGEERFSTCPKCGVVLKDYLAKQRQESQQRKNSHQSTPPPPREYIPPPIPVIIEEKTAEPPQQTVTAAEQVAEIIDNMHPVNLIGWGCALAATVILIMGIMNLIDYNPAELKAQLSYQRDEQVSSWYVFSRHGLLPWLKTLYGLAMLVSAVLFLQHRLIALKMLIILIRGFFVFVPLYLLGSFVAWILAPIPHTVGGYFIETINMIFMTALFCIPLFITDYFLRDERVVSVVKLPFQT